VDASPQALLSTLGPVGTFVAPVDDKLFRGRLRGKSMRDVAKVLIASAPDLFPAAVTPPKGKGPKVDLNFRTAPPRDLFRLLGDVMRTTYVLQPGPVPELFLLVKSVPADATATLIATAIGRELERAGGITYVRQPGAPGLDPGLIAKGGPLVDIVARDVRPGELYAAIAALGIEVGGGAPCTGNVIELRVRKVSAGAALAAIAAISGVPPAAGSSCVLPAGERREATALRAIVTTGTKRTAVVDQPGGAALIDSAHAGDSLGADWLIRSGQDPLRVDPDPTTARPIAARIDGLVRGRLAATIVEDYRTRAVVELPDHTWEILDDREYTMMEGRVAGLRLTAPGQLRFTLYPDPQMSAPPEEHNLVLAERPPP
jgi:hypothetical protein